MSSTPYTTTDTIANPTSSPVTIGGDATSLVGFWGATPIVQRSGAVQAILSTYTYTSYGPVYGFANGTYFNALISLVNEMYSTLTTTGIWKGGA